VSGQTLFLALLGMVLLGLGGPIAGCASQTENPQLSQAAVGDADGMSDDVVIEDAGRSPGAASGQAEAL